jgi:predicted acylesterase/phospholipase RssA
MDRPRDFLRTTINAAAGALLAAMLASCVTVTRPGPPGDVAVASALLPGFQPAIRFVNPDSAVFAANVRESITKARAAALDGSLDILALSGGGSGGGFGAGVMKGLTDTRRPQFELVTGVSTGALIAPFAFLGPDWDDELERAYTSGEAEALTASFGFASLFRVGLLGSSNLRNLVDSFVTPELVRAIAVQHGKGRLLLVATTNLDAEQPVYWNIGEIAVEGGEASRKLIVDILVASSSIPGAIPPVLFPVVNGEKSYSEVHVDGGVTVPFFIFPEIAYLSEDPIPELEGANIHIVINGHFEAVQKPARVSLIAITLRSFNVGLIRMARSELFLAASLARQHRMNLRFTYIPPAFPFESPFDFRRESTTRLYNFGRDCARNGEIWISGADMVERASGQAVASESGCPAPKSAN